MKVTAMVLTLFVLAAPLSHALRASADGAAQGDRSITQVVKLLQSMLEKSKTEADTERTLYAKFKCYCDTNKDKKETSIDTYTKQISLLESEIEELQNSNGLLSREVSQLNADMSANVASRGTATAIRLKEKTAFDGLKSDLETAIAQMDRAITTLGEIGADQTLSSGGDHAQFVAGHSLVKLQSTVRQALDAASAFLSLKQTKTMESFIQGSFIQGPFTGTYTSQSGEIVGILKSMRDTFASNLETAKTQEATALTAHGKFSGTMLSAHGKMTTSYNAKGSQLSSNDGDLSTKKGQLTDARDDLSDDETFLSNLLSSCAEKAKEYDNRVALRTNEDAAIAQAIAILNSDAAFASFGKVGATTSEQTEASTTAAPLFLQRASVSRHENAPSADQRQKAQQLLKGVSLPHMAKIAALLQANNPFKVILKEIKKMIVTLEKEEDADDDQFSWCNTERTKSDATVTTKKSQITSLNTQIDTLDTKIDHPETGLNVQIQTTTDNLEANIQAQKDQTEDRVENNLAYQANVADLVEAETLVGRAVEVLTVYYAKILEAGLLQKQKAAKQTPPATWDAGADSKEGGYSGQSSNGNKALNMLKFILTTTKTEETTAHTDENSAQHVFEDAMAALKTSQGTMEKSLSNLKKSLATSESDRNGKHGDLKSTTEEKESVEDYLVSIKNGCDFITTHIDERKTNRVTETAALNKVSTYLKESPAYTNFESQQHDEDLGDCLSKCEDESHVDCKACLAKVTVTAYCVNHSTTNGC